MGLVERLQGETARVEAALSALQQQASAVRARIEALLAEHDASRSNLGRLRLAITVVSDPQVGRPQLLLGQGYAKVWTDFLAWAKPLLARLLQETATPPERWYADYDYERVFHLLGAFDDIVERDHPAAIADVLADLRQGLIPRMEELAARWDELNAAGQAAAAAGDQGAVDAARAEIAQIDAALEEMARTVPPFAKRRMGLVLWALDGIRDRMAALEAPERGRLDPDRTTPRRIAVRRRRAFTVGVRGRGVPRDIRPDEIGLPDGLRAVSVDGGGRYLHLRIVKDSEPAAGEHELDVAGEKLPFTISPEPDTPPGPEEDDPAEPHVARGPDLSAPASEIDEGARGTLLTPTLLADHPQELVGFWTFRSEDSTGDGQAPMRFTLHEDGERALLTSLRFPPLPRDDLEPHQRYRSGELGGLLGQYREAGERRYEGLRSTSEREPGKCPGYCWWSPSRLRFDEDFLTGHEDVTSRKHDESCEVTSGTDQLDADYERFVGFRFVPFAGQKYIHLLGSPAVGPQAAQLRAAIKLSWDYGPLEAARVVLTMQRDEEEPADLVTLEPGDAGEREIVLDRAGRYRFVGSVYAEDGELLHRDRALAEVPGIPGIEG